MTRKITLIRHGKTSGNAEKRYIGVTDEPLTISGENEVKHRDYPEANIVFSSPLSRCIRTAELIYPNNEIIVIDNLRETDFGLFEGKNYLELPGLPEYQQWIESGGEAAFPNGEGRQDAILRMMDGFNEILERMGDANQISIVAHGGTIMAILSEIFGGDYYSYHVENCEGYTFDLSSDGIYSGLCPRSFNR